MSLEEDLPARHSGPLRTEIIMALKTQLKSGLSRVFMAKET